MSIKHLMQCKRDQEISPNLPFSGLASLAFLAVFVPTGTILAQSIPGEVQMALEKYADLDPISIHWRGPATIQFRGEIQGLSVESKYSRHEDRFSWMCKRTILSDQPHNAEVGSIEKRICRFDGDVVFSTYGDSFASMYKVGELSEAGPERISFNLPYFEAVGIYCPTRQGDLVGGRLKSNILYLIENGGRLVSCEETTLEQEAAIRIEVIADNPAWEEILAKQDKQLEYDRTRLNDEPNAEVQIDLTLKAREERERMMPRQLRWVYYLSPENQYAVRKHERLTMNGRVTTSYLNTVFRSLPEVDITLARKVKKSAYEYIGSNSYDLLETPFHVVEPSLVEFSTDRIPLDQFAADMDEIPPGATVVDGVNPDLRLADGTVAYFDMPASPAQLDAVIAASSARHRLGRSNYARQFLAISAVAFVLLAGYRLYSKRKVHRG